jgi:hypothetical protein
MHSEFQYLVLEWATGKLVYYWWSNLLLVDIDFPPVGNLVQYAEFQHLCVLLLLNSAYGIHRSQRHLLLVPLRISARIASAGPHPAYTPIFRLQPEQVWK